MQSSSFIPKGDTKNYDQVAEIVKAALSTIRNLNLPDQEIPPVLADFSIWAALRMQGTPGGQAILERIRHEVTEWTIGRHPMQEALRSRGEKVPTSERLFEDPEFDGTPLRIAMEHLLSHQRVPLEQAAACFSIYALRLVYDNMGPSTAQALLNTTRREFEQLEIKEREG